MRAAVVMCLALAACASPAAPVVTASAQHGNPCTRAGRACVDMYVVAHEDDDLLFMNPDIARSIAAGNHVVIVHVTTGDLPASSVAAFASQDEPPDFTGYWVDRERGILNAFTAMARGTDAAFAAYQPAGVVPDGWTARVIEPAGVAMPEYSLGESVTAVFVRLSDFQLQPAWNDLPGAGGQAGGESLAAGNTVTDACADPVACPLGTVTPRSELSRETLIDVLDDLIERYHADSVSAQDGTTPTLGASPSGLYWDQLGTPAPDGYNDYWDHVYSAGFTMVAATRAQAAMSSTLSLRLYRDYTISQEPDNLGDAEALAKIDVFARYAVFDASIVEHGKQLDLAAPEFHSDDYDAYTHGSWQHRELATRTLLGAAPLHGRLAVDGTCVTTTGLAPCDGAPSWTISATNQLTIDGSSCLAAGAMVPCTPQTPANTLFLFGNGQLRSADAQCVTASGTLLTSAECAHEEAPHATGRVPASQDFTLLFDAPHALAIPAGAIDVALVDGHACLRDATGMSCAPYEGTFARIATIPADATDVTAVEDSGQIEACARSAGIVTCGTRQFADHAADRIVRYVDVDGDGRIDVCGRGVAGISCSPAVLGTDSFADARGWSVASSGDTIQFADVDGDGLPDACGRGPDGLTCTPQLAGRFTDEAVWTFDEDRTNDLTRSSRDFSDRDPDEPWAFAPALYGSIRLVDVNHDGLADACALGAAGLYCAFSTGTAFERKKLVLPRALTGATALAWGDLDGHLDVCGLTGQTLACTTAY